MYLQPPPPSTLGFSTNQGIVPKVDTDAALRLLKDNATKIDTAKVHIFISII